MSEHRSESCGVFAVNGKFTPDSTVGRLLKMLQPCRMDISKRKGGVGVDNEKFGIFIAQIRKVKLEMSEPMQNY